MRGGRVGSSASRPISSNEQVHSGPGRHFKDLLEACLEAQLDGVFADLDGGVEFARKLLATQPLMAPDNTSPETLSSLHRAVLLTVLYSDLFDQPLTGEELHCYLAAPCPDRQVLDLAVEALDRSYLGTADGLVYWRGREATIELRRHRQRLAAERWGPARRFARWLGWVPFLRMVAVCGSQAMDNGDVDGDVDLFLITEPGRLWLVQSLTMVLRRAGRRLGIDICPNYLLASSALEIEERNLYTAREAAQTMPLWGDEAYASFVEANRWIDDFLPQRFAKDVPEMGKQTDVQCRFLEPVPRHRLTAVLERLLGGRLGDVADRAIHRALLLYYRLRLRRYGWRRQEIEGAYRRDRQEVITGGYAAAVARRFVDRGVAELGDRISAGELRGIFFGEAVEGTGEPGADREAPDPLYAGLMETRYGGGS